MPIIRSSRVLYGWPLPVVFGALVFRLSVWCGAGGYVSGLQAAALLLCFGACRPWVTEGQLKKRVRIFGPLFVDYLACLVEGLYVELLEG